MDILKNNPAITQETADQVVLDYLKTRDKDWQLQTGDKGNVDVQNTMAAIKARMWSIPTQAQSQQKDLTDRATAAYDKAQANIESQYKAEKDSMLKAWAVEDRYTNFNEVNDNINKTLLEAGKHRAENLYTGMPTDDQITEIAQKSGNDFATTKKILEGRWFEDLQMQGEFKAKSEQWANRTLDDLKTSMDRANQDADTAHTRAITGLNEQIDDVKTQMERNISVGQKQWALSGAVRSSGYIQGLDNIKNDAMKNMDRLKLRQDWDTADTVQLKGRISDEYNKNTTRTKEDLETAMNQIKTQNWAALSQYLNEYAPSSTELTRKLDELDDKFGTESQQAFNMYLSNLRGITDTMTYDTEKVMQLQSMKQQLQQTSVQNLLQDNWAALAGISYNDLNTMLKSGDISAADYTTMTGYMKTLGMSTLQKLGIPNQQDFALYNQMLDQGSSPQQAIAAITSANPTRFTTSTNTGFQWLTTSPSSGNAGATVNRAAQVASMKNLIVSNAVASNDNVWQAKWISQMQDGTVGGQCGEFSNDINQALGWPKLFGNSLASKVAQITDKTPKVGDFIVMDTWVKLKDGTPAGHVWYVEAINADGSLQIKDSNWNWDEKISSHPVQPTDSRIKWFVDPNKAKWAANVDDTGVTDNTIAQTQWQMSKIEQMDFENYVMNFVPQQDRWSDKEKERIVNYVKEAMANWRTAEQAGLAYRWFNITDSANNTKAMEYMWILNNLPKFPDWGARILSDYINKWDVAGASKYVANKVDDAVQTRYWTDAIKTANVNNQWASVDRINSLISSNQNDIGAFDGRIADFKKKFKNMPEIQELDTLLTMLQAETRKNFAGSNVTPSEMVALQDFVWGNKKMTAENLKTMINTIYGKVKQEYSLQRQDYWYTPTNTEIDSPQWSNAWEGGVVR